MEHNIREIINRNDIEFRRIYFKDHNDEWNILCASMDTIGDTTLAINDFQEKGIGKANGERYLRLYGLLQAVFLQQDAIKFLYEVIQTSFDTSNVLKAWGSHSMKSWEELRRYRNLSSGHPIENKTFERGKTKRAMISRITISQKGFQLLIFDSDGSSTEFPYVDLGIDSYLVEAKAILSDVEHFLNSYQF